MNLKFTKMYGLGNDFILINCLEQSLGEWETKIGELSRRLCHRHFGIGADQVLLMYASDVADFRMMIFNSDGSEVEMCGNGIRCFAKYIWDRSLSGKEILSVETAAGIIRPEKAGEMVRVDMGEPVLEGRMIPVNMDGPIKDIPVRVDDAEFRITGVSMGNPHAVIFVEDVYSVDVKGYGPAIERHELFPNRINVEFVQVLDSENVRMRVWERGAGETMACGTGASAAAVASHLQGFTGRLVNVHLAGGELLIEWKENNHVYMTGPAVEVFEGTAGLDGG
jgi:diaminopimelate epimerase